MTLRGAPGAPTVSVDAIWKTQTAFASPLASRVRSDPVIRSAPPAGFQTPAARVSPPKFAPGSPVDGIAARVLYAVCASARALVAIENVVAVPSFGHVIVGGGVAVYIVPLTAPTLSVVSVYMHPDGGTYGTVLSWNPVTVVDAPIVPISPLITVLIPWLVNPAGPPMAPAKVPEVPRLIGPAPVVVVPVVKVHTLFAPKALP